MYTETNLPEMIACDSTVSRVIFKNKDFNILLFDTPYGSISVKNCYGNFEVGQKLWLEAILDGNEKYPESYTCKKLGDKAAFVINENDIFAFLTTVVGDKTHELLEQTFTPKKMKEILDNSDIETLMTINGIGEQSANKIIKAYNNYGDYDLAYSKIGKQYNLTLAAVTKIVKYFKNNPVLTVEKVTENPYCLTEVPGFGFKKADSSYLFFHEHSLKALCSPQRIEAYIEYVFEELAKNGSSYLTTDLLVNNVLENIQGAKLTKVIEVFNNSDKFTTITDENNIKRLCLNKILEKEKFVAKRLKEMVEESSFDLKNIDSIVSSVEKINGYPFSKDQCKAIASMIVHNVFLLQGYAGTGKSTSVGAFTSILAQNGINFIQCCISGKAADNLRKITGYEACTIASLLLRGVSEYQCIIIDEISMVDLDNFSKLLSMISPKTKLIMMGDSAQLDAIGISVVNGMIDSKLIPTIVLDKIHRQAENSAIITHSLAMRQGKKHDDIAVVKQEMKTYGVNQDLSYIFLDSEEEDKILKYSLKLYQRYIQEVGIDEVQMLCATKTKGTVSVEKLNMYAQLIANPRKDDLNEYQVTNADRFYILREGDRIVNTKNEKDPLIVSKPIFNGNTGRLLSINDDQMEIYFDGIGEVTLKKSAWSNIELGYAMSIHKSQGSTIRNVIVALPYHYMLNSRELLYTAVTRASNRAVIVTSPRSYKRSLDITSKRVTKTNLSILIKEEFEV